MVTITVKDGSEYTDPGDILIRRNENTEAFYEMLENYILTPEEKEQEDCPTYPGTRPEAKLAD